MFSNVALDELFLKIKDYEYQLMLVVILLFTVLFYSRLVGKRRKLPPGPWGVPFFGYFPFVGEKPHLTFHRLSRKYGKVFGLNFGSSYVVVLNDWESVKETFSKTATANRPASLASNIPNGLGFGGENGVVWAEQRRFVMKAMKDIGFGRTRWEQLVQEELHEVVGLIERHGGSPIDIRSFFACTFTNNVMTLIFGHRLPLGHPDTELVSDCVDYVTQSLSSVALFVYFPTLSNVLTKLGFGNQSLIKKITNFTDFTTKAIEKRIKTNKGHEIEAFVDEYIAEMKRYEEKQLSSSFSEKLLRGNTQSLLVGGSETSRTSLNFLLIAIADYPAIQKRVHDELDRVIGKDGTIKWSERSQVPYTFAVIMEGMRWKQIVPLNSARLATEDIQIKGYDIPEGTVILANNWALHNDPKYWNEPEKFIPERFLLDDGKSINFKPESYVPFSYGKRACPGELIAMMEVLLYFVTLMQKFEVLPQDGDKVKYDTILGLTYQPINAKLRFIPRN